MKKIVVTGATSMIGAALLCRLVKDSQIEKIYAVVRTPLDEAQFSKRNRLPKDEKIQIIECDISDYSRLPELVNDTCDTFYHLAWPRTLTYKESIEDILSKCDSAKYVIEALYSAYKIGCKKFIGAGSQSEYGLVKEGIYNKDLYCKPVRADGVVHLMAGQLAMMVAESFDMKCIWMRIFSVYGTNDRLNSMISSTIDKLIKGEHCSFTKSEQTWDFIYEKDIAEAFYLVGEKINENKIYNVANGTSRPLKDYIETIRDVVSPKTVLGIGELDYPPNAIMRMEVDVSELVSDTGWRPKTDFKSGIEEIYKAKKS